MYPRLVQKFLLLWITILLSMCDADRIIIDTDAGGDDAIAILLFLRAESQKVNGFPHELIAITCSYGNTKEEHVETNVLKILTITNRSDVPVYGGALHPFKEIFPDTYFYGKDGFGDFDFPHKLLGSVNKSVPASTVLVELTKQYDDVSIIVLGPTTNVALAASLDPKFTSRVKHFWVMGSSIAAVGNLRPNVEFNFAADPEANYILLSSTKASQLTLFPWDTGFKANVSKEWRQQTLANYKSPFIDFLNKVEAIGLTSNEPNYVSADSMTVAIMLKPSIVTESVVSNVEAVTDGRARGSVLVDYLGLTDRQPNAKLIQTIVPESYKELLIYYLSCEYLPCNSNNEEEESDEDDF